ncbi:MAG: hypothetical protein JWO65_2315 [Sphingomonas bacterium]|nr:hypothetical protein [Sphingomonas bacterium]
MRSPSRRRHPARSKPDVRALVLADHPGPGRVRAAGARSCPHSLRGQGARARCRFRRTDARHDGPCARTVRAALSRHRRDGDRAGRGDPRLPRRRTRPRAYRSRRARLRQSGAADDRGYGDGGARRASSGGADGILRGSEGGSRPRGRRFPRRSHPQIPDVVRARARPLVRSVAGGQGLELCRSLAVSPRRGAALRLSQADGKRGARLPEADRPAQCRRRVARPARLSVVRSPPAVRRGIFRYYPELDAA